MPIATKNDENLSGTGKFSIEDGDGTYEIQKAKSVTIATKNDEHFSGGVSLSADERDENGTDKNPSTELYDCVSDLLKQVGPYFYNLYYIINHFNHWVVRHLTWGFVSM